MELFVFLFILANVLTFFLYAIDKLKAKKGARRISEKVLIFFTIAFGGIGALLGMCLLRHKTRKGKFRVAVVVGLPIALFSVLFSFYVIRTLLPFPTFYAERYVSVSTFSNELGEEYVELFVNLINSAEIRPETFAETERRQNLGQSPCEIIAFTNQDGEWDILQIREDIIFYNNRRFVIENFQEFRLGLDKLIASTQYATTSKIDVSVSSFEIITDVIRDASEYSILMEASVSGDILIVTIQNNSDEDFIFTSGSYLNNNYSPILYFDGENWRTVPIRQGLTFVEYDSAYLLEPGDDISISLNLVNYQMPESGLFRFQLRQSLSTEFTLG